MKNKKKRKGEKSKKQRNTKKNRKNQKVETLQILNSTIVLQVDEVKYYNQNQTLLVLLCDGKYILVVNIELTADQNTNSKFRIQFQKLRPQRVFFGV